MRLLLNNTEVFPKEDTSIKIVKENPIMTGSGTYTLDIELPMDIEENQLFFNNINRKDVTKRYHSYDAEMVVRQDEFIVGTAIITEVTQDLVKIQVLAGNSNINFMNVAEERFIDEFDYNASPQGDIVMNWIRSHSLYYYIDWTEDSRQDDYKDKYWYIGDISEQELFGFIGVPGKFVVMPFVDEDVEEKYGAHKGNKKIRTMHVDGVRRGVICMKNAHPNLLYVATTICAYMGYKADFSCLWDRGVGDIYIASARPFTSLAMMLPHWTVKEFFTEFCHLLNITLVFNDIEKTVSVNTNKHLSEKVVELKEIVEEFEAKIGEDEDSANILLSSIAYASSNNNVQNMDDNERSKYRLVNVDYWSQEALRTAYNNTPENERNWCFYGKNSGIWTFDSAGNMHDVDVFRPLNRGTKECEEIRIVPAKTTLANMGVSYDKSEYSIIDTGEDFIIMGTLKYRIYKEGWMGMTFEGFRRVLSLSNKYGGYQKAVGSLWEKINGEDTQQEHGEKENYMPVYLVSKNPQGIYANKYNWDCFYYKYYTDGEGRHINLTERYPERYPAEFVQGTEYGSWWCDNYDIIPFTDKWVDGFNWNSEQRDCEATFALDRRDINWSVYMFHSGMPTYNIGVVQQFRFLSPAPPDTTAVFHIRGKRYACKKIEYDINEDGIDQLMTGYFVEILN